MGGMCAQIGVMDGWQSVQWPDSAGKIPVDLASWRQEESVAGVNHRQAQFVWAAVDSFDRAGLTALHR